MTRADARQQLGIGSNDRTLLFFGQIAPYKGLEYLVEAIAQARGDWRASPTDHRGQGQTRERGLLDECATLDRSSCGISEMVNQTVRFIPDDQVEPYFLASDAVVIPYVDIFQSGVPFLAFSFGLPVIATDVGSLRDDVTERDRVCSASLGMRPTWRAPSPIFSGAISTGMRARPAHASASWPRRRTPGRR